MSLQAAVLIPNVYVLPLPRQNQTFVAQKKREQGDSHDHDGDPCSCTISFVAYSRANCTLLHSKRMQVQLAHQLVIVHSLAKQSLKSTNRKTIKRRERGERERESSSLSRPFYLSSISVGSYRSPTWEWHQQTQRRR